LGTLLDYLGLREGLRKALGINYLEEGEGSLIPLGIIWNLPELALLLNLLVKVGLRN